MCAANKSKLLWLAVDPNLSVLHNWRLLFLGLVGVLPASSTVLAEDAMRRFLFELSATGVASAWNVLARQSMVHAASHLPVIDPAVYDFHGTAVSTPLSPTLRSVGPQADAFPQWLSCRPGARLEEWQGVEGSSQRTNPL